VIFAVITFCVASQRVFIVVVVVVVAYFVIDSVRKLLDIAQYRDDTTGECYSFSFPCLSAS
jgi:hypothetical protein